MVIVADNLQIIRNTISGAVATGNPEPIRALVRQCAAAGADAIDINSGPLGRSPERSMAFLVATVESATDLPLMIDSANPVALAAGLAAATRPAILNGFSLEPAKVEKILPLAARTGSDIVGYLLGRDGHVPMSADERMAVAVELFQTYMDAGCDPARLILDPVVVPVTWQEGHRQAVEVLDVIRQLPDLLGYPVRTIVGLSNLTTGVSIPDRRGILERAYLPMLASAGLDMVLMNVLCPESIRIARACRMLLSNHIFSWKKV
ncbi:MAG: dihydropteroate synthase [Desulfobacterales bacterium]|nr:dihydropteroate synthase [Desulfobacterales bacterium]